MSVLTDFGILENVEGFMLGSASNKNAMVGLLGKTLQKLDSSWHIRCTTHFVNLTMIAFHQDCGAAELIYACKKSCGISYIRQSDTRVAAWDSKCDLASVPMVVLEGFMQTLELGH